MESLIAYCTKIWSFPVLWLSWLVQRATFPRPLLSKTVYDELIEGYGLELIWIKVNMSDKAKTEYAAPCVYLNYYYCSFKPELPLRSMRYTVLMSHGNGSDLAALLFSRFPRPGTFKNCALPHMFYYDYPGYSLSRFTATNIFESVNTTEGNVNRAAEVAWTYLVMECKIPPSRIILFGVSIGCGPTIHLASSSNLPNVPEELCPKNAAALVLISPPLSTMRTVFGGNSCLLPLVNCFDKFKNYEKICDIDPNIPVGLLHAKNDKVVPYNHKVEIENRLPNKEKQLLYSLATKNGGHNFEGDLEWDSEQESLDTLPKLSNYIENDILDLTITRLQEIESVRDRFFNDIPEEKLFGNYKSCVMNQPTLKDYGRKKRLRCLVPWSILAILITIGLLISRLGENTEPVLDTSLDETQAPIMDDESAASQYTYTERSTLDLSVSSHFRKAQVDPN